MTWQRRLTNLHWLSVNHRRKLGMRRISEAGIEAIAVQIVVDHWRLGRAPAKQNSYIERTWLTV
jgi:hypothetical protein